MGDAYTVTETSTGRSVSPGDMVTNFRGESGTFTRVTRGPEYNGTAKVLVNGREFYTHVWGLTVHLSRYGI